MSVTFLSTQALIQHLRTSLDNLIAPDERFIQTIAKKFAHKTYPCDLLSKTVEVILFKLGMERDPNVIHCMTVALKYFGHHQPIQFPQALMIETYLSRQEPLICSMYAKQVLKEVAQKFDGQTFLYEELAELHLEKTLNQFKFEHDSIKTNLKVIIWSCLKDRSALANMSDLSNGHELAQGLQSSSKKAEHEEGMLQ